MLRTFYCWVVIVFWTFFWGTVGVFLSLTFPKWVNRYAIRPWGRFILSSCGIKVELEGKENLPQEPSVIMYNHQSSFDIFAFCGYLPIEWKAVMKKEVASVPFVGWVSRITGNYFVERDGSSRDTQEIRKIAERIRSGPSVLIAPEGTRSPDGKLLPFKKGGFVVAIYAKVPVVPMVITGGKEIMSRGSKRINRGNMKINILPPIDVRHLPPGKEGREMLMEKVKNEMLRALGQDERVKVAL